jgi:hypothetical protein
MIGIKLNNENNSIIINIESNTILPGSYTDASYNTPSDYKLIQINNLVDEAMRLSSNAQTNVADLTEDQILAVTYETNTKIISTAEDVKELFTPSTSKYFVTGVTDTKFALINKYFNKKDVITTIQATEKINFTQEAGDGFGGTVTIEDPTFSNSSARINIKFIIPGLGISAMILVDDPDYPEYVLYLDTENPVKYVDLGNNLSIFSYMRSNTVTEPTPNLILFDGLIEEPKIISEVFIDRGLNSAFERAKKLKNVKDINQLSKAGLGYYKINKKGYNFKNI